jgi:hypothetical protein
LRWFIPIRRRILEACCRCQPEWDRLMQQSPLDKQATTSGPVRPVVVMLPGGASAPTSSNPTAFTYPVAYLMGPERDDPTQPNGVCRAIDKLSPATLTLTIGSTPITVKNADPASATNKSIYGCHLQPARENDHHRLRRPARASLVPSPHHLRAAFRQLPRPRRTLPPRQCAQLGASPRQPGAPHTSRASVKEGQRQRPEVAHIRPDPPSPPPASVAATSLGPPWRAKGRRRSRSPLTHPSGAVIKLPTLTTKLLTAAEI